MRSSRPVSAWRTNTTAGRVGCGSATARMVGWIAQMSNREGEQPCAYSPPGDPIEQPFFHFDQASEKSCTTSVRAIFWQLLGTAGHSLEMEPKTVGHRTIVNANRVTD